MTGGTCLSDLHLSISFSLQRRLSTDEVRVSRKLVIHPNLIPDGILRRIRYCTLVIGICSRPTTYLTYLLAPSGTRCLPYRTYKHLTPSP